MCNSQAETYSLDPAGRAAAQQAIPSTFGPNPCALYEATAPVLVIIHTSYNQQLQHQEHVWQFQSFSDDMPAPSD